jgi:hypothetical protein
MATASPARILLARGSGRSALEDKRGVSAVSLQFDPRLRLIGQRSPVNRREIPVDDPLARQQFVRYAISHLLYNA